MATYEKDRFDELPDDLLRRGAHRAPPQKGRGWIGFGWAALATVVLVFVGLSSLHIIDIFPTASPTSSAIRTPTPTPTPTAEPKIDPAIAITVLNGTPTTGLANTVGNLLVKEGWGGAAEGVGSRSNASTTDVKKTLVFYSDPKNEGAARALVLALKAGEIRLANDYPESPITVLIGLDYKPGA